ncbi:hypothetical protein [Streptomyces sp. NPDC005141]
MMAELVPRELAYYGEAFSARSLPQGLHSPRYDGGPDPGENALFLVQKVGPHVIGLQREIERYRAAPRVEPMPLAERAEAVARTLRQQARTGESLGQTSLESLEYKIGKGWDPADPLINVSLKWLVRESGTGGSDPRQHWVEPGGRWEPMRVAVAWCHRP